MRTFFNFAKLRGVFMPLLSFPMFQVRYQLMRVQTPTKIR